MDAIWMVTCAAVVAVAAALAWQRSKSVRATVGWALLGVVAGSVIAGIVSYAPTGAAFVAGFALAALAVTMIIRRVRATQE